MLLQKVESHKKNIRKKRIQSDIGNIVKGEEKSANTKQIFEEGNRTAKGKIIGARNIRSGIKRKNCRFKGEGLGSK